MSEAQTANGEARKITIEPVTRVEGHGKVTVLLDEDNNVERARLHIVEFRGFERFIQGRPYWEVPVLVQRLCGICPVSHHLCAAKAMDMIVGADQLTPTAEKMRRLMHYGQMFQSHVLHFFHLCSPDILFGFDADPAIRNVVGVAMKHPELAVQGIEMRRYGQEIIRVTAGKRIHGTGAVPGGVNKNLSIEERDYLLKDLDQMIEWSKGALTIAREYTVENAKELASLSSFASNHVSLVGSDGEMDLYDGGLRAVDSEGKVVFDHVEPVRYQDVLAEEARSWSYMKFPYIKELGSEKGWYRVGPLARVCACSSIPTPEAESLRKEFKEFAGNKPHTICLATHWARMIEVVHSIEMIRNLLHDSDLQGTDLVTEGEHRREGIAIIEAPRGSLFHHYRINDNDQIERANLIVSTTNNNDAMNTAVGNAARKVLQDGQIKEGDLNSIEVAIRAYDPCLSCATHAVGQMPLEVEVVDADGTVRSSAKKQ